MADDDIDDLDGDLTAILEKSVGGESDSDDGGSEDLGEEAVVTKPKNDFTDTLSKPSKHFDPNDGLDDEDDEEVEKPETDEAAQPAGDKKDRGDKGFDVFDYVKTRHGIDLASKYKSPEDAIDGLANAQRKLSERDEDAAWGRQLRSDPEAVFKLLAPHYGPSGELDPRDNPTKKAADKPQAPEWKDEWLDELDETGKPKPDADKEAVAGIKRYRKFQQEAGNRILRTFGADPEAEIQRRIDEGVKKALTALPKSEDAQKLREELEQRELAGAYERRMGELIEPHKNVFFVDGDRSKGKTPAGQVMARWLDATKDAPQTHGITFNTLEAAWNWALSQAKSEMAQSPEKYNGSGGKKKPQDDGERRRKSEQLERPRGGKNRRGPDDDEFPEAFNRRGGLAAMLRRTNERLET